MPDFHTAASDLSEHELLQKYRAYMLAAWIAGIAFTVNAVLAVIEVAHGHYVGLPGRLGVSTFISACWFSTTFRAYAVRHRTFNALAVLRTPLEWFPSPFSPVASVGGDTRTTQLLVAEKHGGDDER